MTAPRVVFASPRKLPKPASLDGRVAVLDIAFAAEGTGTSFDRVTAPFLKGLGDRLAAWVDHHDHALHARYRGDPRFVLATKAEHGACPEMVTPELIARTGAVDTLVCHSDLDGLYSAARWIRGGVDPYPGAEDDARAVDTRVGATSPLGDRIDRALRARGRDEDFLARVVRFLVGGATDPDFAAELVDTAREYDRVEAATRALAQARYRVREQTAVCDVTDVAPGDYDKTELLLLGQAMARVAVVLDAHNVSVAAAFDSGLNFLTMLGVAGGMPTRVAVPRSREAQTFGALARHGLM